MTSGIRGLDVQLAEEEALVVCGVCWRLRHRRAALGRRGPGPPRSRLSCLFGPWPAPRFGPVPCSGALETGGFLRYPVGQLGHLATGLDVGIEPVSVPLPPPALVASGAFVLAGGLPLQRLLLPPLCVFPPQLLGQLVPARLDQLLAGKLPLYLVVAVRLDLGLGLAQRVAPGPPRPPGGLAVQALPARLLEHDLGHHSHLRSLHPKFSHHQFSLFLPRSLQPAGHDERRHRIVHVFDSGLPQIRG
ncbi:hypothetical protein EYF80_023924 [Liparis tanakae]|uniref:Uncharacterized protein n=1 Tax=Liparis tanakae TaxID=230148 RepID=A0A4Z2HLV5_9TELE|nr:hypothetical protein EYF80_023924 [Liparis tanakae]